MAAVIIGAGFASPLFGGGQTVKSSISFRSPMTLTKLADLDFGIVDAGIAGTYTVTPFGVISATGTGQILGGTPSATRIVIAGSSTQAINISEGGHRSDNGVNVAAVKCSYDGGPSGACSINGASAPGLGKVLLVGATVVANGSQTNGTMATPSFSITVVYH